MPSIESIAHAIEQLSAQELAKFRHWFLEFDAAAWDQQIESDAAAGKLDGLAEEALKEFRTGQVRGL